MRHFLEDCFNFKKRPARGFTLAELLIALAILGIISTFTIPKILGAQQNSNKKTVLRETLATLSAITYEGVLKREITADNYRTYVFGKINAVKICNGNATVEGCFAHTDDTGAESDGPGFVLHNGATVAGIENCCDDGGGVWVTGFVLDWNGATGPNIVGDDQMWLRASFGTASFDGVVRPGTIAPIDDPSKTLFESIFSN